jgi:hypothetical protein
MRRHASVITAQEKLLRLSSSESYGREVRHVLYRERGELWFSDDNEYKIYRAD